MDPKTIGLAAAILTTISFFPQALKIYKTNDTTSLSLGMFSLFTLAVVLWLIYGIIIKDTPIILSNSIVAPLSFYIVTVKIRNNHKKD